MHKYAFLLHQKYSAIAFFSSLTLAESINRKIHFSI